MEHKEIEEHFDGISRQYDDWKKKNNYYYSELKALFASFIPSGKKVLEIGCGTGEILNSVKPEKGLGIDISSEMIRIAQSKYPHLSFEVKDAEHFESKEKYEYVVMSDILEHLVDVWEAFSKLRQIVLPSSQVIISFINPLWEPLLILGEKLGMKMPEGPHNRLYSDDIINLLELNYFEVKEKGYKLFLPKKIPFLSDFLNKHIPMIPWLKNFCFVQYIVAMPKKKEDIKRKSLSCSVVIPCHNEEENIEECIRRIPQMGSPTEIIVVDDGSTDGTASVVENLLLQYENLRLISYKTNKGKGFAVKRGFDEARGDVLIILDADMSVLPEELSRFFAVMEDGKADFVNGTRMVYPMEQQAMRQLNLLGNKIFSIIFTWLLGRRITDTLCGTKVILRKDYKRIQMGKCPWGDFDILIGVAKLNLRMKEIPVHYKQRKLGTSKMKTFKHGFLLLRMCLYAFKELKLKRG